MKHFDLQIRGARVASLLRCGALVAVFGALATGCATDADSAGSEPSAGEADQAVSATGFTIAMQSNATGGNHLWIVTSTSAIDTTLSMSPGTSPAIVTAGSSYAYAFRAASGHLWLRVPGAPAADTGHTTKAGTSPSIAALTGGGYQVAYQGDDGFLWTYGSAGSINHGLGMAPGTSPSISSRPENGAYQIAFQANTNKLWLAGNTTPSVNTNLPMQPGTNPSIARIGSNYEVAYGDNTGFLEVWHSFSGSVTNTALGLMSGTSPSIAPSGTSYNIAFNANATGHLWTSNGGDTGLVMKAGTSPAFASKSSGATELAFQDPATFLHTLDANGSNNQALGMDPASSPAAN